jgi:cytochrome c peroxidase
MKRPKKIALVGIVTLLIVARAAVGASVSSEGRESSIVPPAAERAEIELGRKLFEDTQLSADGTVACVSCHSSASDFGDHRARSVGVHNRLGTRHAPSLRQLAVYRCFFWDCRAQSLEDQVSFPFLNPTEMGHETAGQAVDYVRSDPQYLHAFERVYGLRPTQIGLRQLARPIVAYERSLAGSVIALDRYLAEDSSALALEERRGLEVFRTKAGCAACHSIRRDSAPLTDGLLHPSAVGLQAVGSRLTALTRELESMDEGQRFRRIATDPAVAALGRFVVTLDPQDLGKFRTPTLRDVGRLGPYMHDGSVATLQEAVDLELYYRGTELGYPIILSPQERSDLLAFLQSLVSDTSDRDQSVRIAARRTVSTEAPVD